MNPRLQILSGGEAADVASRRAPFAILVGGSPAELVFLGIVLAMASG